MKKHSMFKQRFLVYVLFACVCSGAHAVSNTEAEVLATSSGISENSVISLTDDGNVSQTDYVNATYDAIHGLVIAASEGTYSVGFGSYVPENYTGPGTLYLHRVLITNQDGVTILDESFDGWAQDSTSTDGSVTRSEYSTDSGTVWATYADTTNFYTGGGSAFDAVDSGGDSGMVYPFDGGGPFSVLIRALITAPANTTELRINLDWRYSITIFGGSAERVFSVGLKEGDVDPEFLFSFSAPANTDPVITSTEVTAVDEDDTYSYTFTATDDDGDDLTLSAPTLPSWLGFTPATGVLTGTPTNADVGDHNVTLRVNDGTIDVDQDFTITVSNTNDSPTGSVTISGTATEDETLTANTGTLGDDDGLGVLSYQWLRSGVVIASATESSYNATAVDIGSTLSVTVTYTDQQGTAESVSSAAFGPIKADLDKDSIADDVDTDIDGDGMSNEFEVANDLDPRDDSDAVTDLDSDGVSNLDEFINDSDPGVDDYGPIITGDPAVTIDAVALLTELPAGLVSARDALDGDVSVRHNMESELLAPGVHTLTWTANDSRNNSTTFEQTLNIRPIANWQVDQESGEGNTLTVALYLNGEAPVYPVVANYSVAGSAANPDDHDASNGTLTITEGQSATITVNVASDAVSENNETIVLTLDSITNAVIGVQETHTIEISEFNHAPTLELVASLDSSPSEGKTLFVDTDGIATIQTVVSDVDVGDDHTFVWTDLGNLNGTASDGTYAFNPSEAGAGVYQLSVTATDDAVDAESGTAVITLTIVENLPTLNSSVDSDNDGIDDAAEGLADSDGDNVPDFADSTDESNLLAMYPIGGEPQEGAWFVESQAGLSLKLNVFGSRTGDYTPLLEEDDIVDANGVDQSDASYAFDGGVFDFVVSNMPVPGETVLVVMPQLSPIPADAVYRKEIDGQWSNYVEDTNNTLSSAPGTLGICPPPGSTDYTPGLTEGYYCVQLGIEDGGANDADGEVNGSILDPGGVGLAQPGTVDRLAQPSTVDSSGGAGSFSLPMLLLMTLISMLSFASRKTTHSVKGA